MLKTYVRIALIQIAKMAKEYTFLQLMVLRVQNVRIILVIVKLRSTFGCPMGGIKNVIKLLEREVILIKLLEREVILYDECTKKIRG